MYTSFCCPVDVAYLVQTRQVSSEDAAFILSKVPQATDPQAAVFNVEASLQELAISDIPPSSTPTNALVKQSQVIPNNVPVSAMPYTEPQQTRRPVPKVPVAPTFKAQALWDYNIDNEVSTPLLCRAGPPSDGLLSTHAVTPGRPVAHSIDWLVLIVLIVFPFNLAFRRPVLPCRRNN
jgi:hypothetical protein